MILDVFGREPGIDSGREARGQREREKSDPLGDSIKDLERLEKFQTGLQQKFRDEARMWEKGMAAGSKLPGVSKIVGGGLAAWGVYKSEQLADQFRENAEGYKEVAEATREIRDHFRDQPERSQGDIARESAAAERMERDSDKGVMHA